MRAGSPDAAARVAAGRARIAADAIDYLCIVDPLTLEPVSTVDRPCRALVVARYGSVRLLDNAEVLP
jgi:pantothenate synthetase